MDVIDAIIDSALSDGRTLLSEVESKSLLEQVGIPVVRTELAKSKGEAIEIARRLGMPVVLKIVSEDIPHKIDVGGVKIDIKHVRQVGLAYDSIMSSTKSAVPNARIQGVSVQKMAERGVEIIIGATKDPQFGHVIMFGLGGVLVELLRDVSIRLVPLHQRDAKSMISEIKSFPLLQGYREYPGCDIESLELALMNLSRFLEEKPIIKELDLNPIISYPKGILAVDARVILEERSLEF